MEPKRNPAEDLLAVHLEELGLHFQRQYKYAKGRKFEADFAVWKDPPHWTKLHPERFALIEIQGGIFSRKAHGSIVGILNDNKRLYYAFLNGWNVIRFTVQQVESGEAKQLISEAMQYIERRKLGLTL